ncbi:MAG TPA: hypothetical protein VK251_10955 [Steroidobacteraceae bacterium]|nr:hypothetical protein [Steroidobacteraceae bacterium]
MWPIRRFRQPAFICLAAILLAACGQREPAQKMLNDIDTAVSAASTEAAKYVPERLIDVQTKLGDLKSAFNRQDYKAVVAAGPPVLLEAQGLASEAAAKKAEVMRALNDQWASLSAAVPGSITAIHDRIDLLSKKSSRKMAKGIDLNAAKSDLDDATSLWSKAQGAFGNGNMDEAVKAAKDARAKLDALATTLKVNPPA